MSLLYQPLNVETYEVRMLQLSPPNPSSRIECSMTAFSLVDNPPRYIALSYCWGDETTTRDITVNGITTPVTINLGEALQQLHQHLDTGVSLWIDALCINQHDQQERSQQIRLMKTIFEKAEGCYAWLGGQGSQDNMHGFQSVRTLLETPRDSGHPAPQLLHPACTELLSICRSPYWQRRWIIQELTAAFEVKVLAGPSMLSLSSLQSAFSECARSSFWLSEHEIVSASLEKVLQLRSEYHEGKSLLLPDAILGTRHCLSKDPRDKIFALIGISSDGTSLVPTPNYAQSVGQVSRDLTRAILHKNANFDIIYSGPRTRDTSTPVPTWTPDWCSPDISQELSAIANAAPMWPRSLAFLALRANPNFLQMGGVTMGTVIALTSPLTSKRDIQADGPTFSSLPTPDHSICKDYYGSTRRITKALVECIMPTKHMTHDKHSCLRIGPSVIQHIYLWFFRFKRSRHTQPDASEPVETFLSWSRVNDAIHFNGNSISQCLQFRYLYIRVYVFIFILLLPIVFAVAGASLWLSPDSMEKKLAAMIILLMTIGLVFQDILLICQYYTKIVRIWSAEDPLIGGTSEAKRIFLLDHGLIGTACTDVRIGDKVCLLAGCNKAAILREHRSQGTLQHSVVGSGFVYLNLTDRRKYGAVWYFEFFCLRDRQEAVADLELCKTEDWWESFMIS